MYEQFIEVTNQIFGEGYAEQLAQENPARFQMELKEFINTYQQAMEDTIFLLVKVRIKTSYNNIHDAIAELQTETAYSVGSTENVE